MRMNQEQRKEHFIKETLKQIVNNSPNYTEQMKQELNSIIDAGKSPEEISKAILTYFGAIGFH